MQDVEPSAAKKKLLGHAGIEAILAYFVRGLGAISLFFLYSVIAKRLSTDDSGYVFLGLATVNIFAPLSVFGLHFLSLRLIGARAFNEHADEVRFLGSRVRWLAGLISSAVAAGMYFAAPWLAATVFNKPSVEGVLQWLAPSVFCSGVSLVYAHQLQGLRKFTNSLFIQSIGTQLLCAILLLLTESATPVFAARLYSLASVANLVFAALSWQFFVGSGPIKQVEIPTIWRSCWSFWVVNAMVLTVNWSGQLIAGACVDNASDVAMLAVATRVANLVGFVLIGANVIVTPRFARCWQQGNTDRLEELALKSTALMSLCTVPMVLVLVFFPKPILSLFKPEYQQAAPLLVLLALSQCFNVITGSVNQLLSMCGFEHDLRNIVVMSGTVALSLGWILTVYYGVLGTAVAATVALGLQNVAAVYIVKKRLGFSMFRAYSPQIWFKRKSDRVAN